MKLVASPREDQPESIVKFATAVQNLTVTLETLKRPEYLPQLIEDIESKIAANYANVMVK